MTGSPHAIAFDQVGLTTSDGREILDHIDLEVATGSTTALLGRSGSGKTTLLRMVNRLIEPTAGKVMVEGKATTDWDPIRLRRSIGYVIQETGLFPHFDMERNIGAVLEIEGRPKQEIAGRARQLFTARWDWSMRPLPTACRTSFPVGNGSAWAWRGRWRPNPNCC